MESGYNGKGIAVKKYLIKSLADLDLPSFNPTTNDA
jgi:hypothetical protein